MAIEFNGLYWYSDENILERSKGKMNAEDYWIKDKKKELNRIRKYL
jgi:hypothetical protein